MTKGYKIKQVAELFSLHPDTLRYYEEQGLIAPGRMENGYRSYSVQDICALGIIRTLRRLDMPVGRIADYMRKRSIAVTLELLAEEQRLIDARVAELRRLKKEVRRRADALAGAGVTGTAQPALVTLPPRKCYRLETPMLHEPYVDVELRRLERDRPELARLAGARQMGAVVDMTAVQGGVYDRFSAVLFLDEQFADSDSVLQGGIYAAVCYRGGYDGLQGALRSLVDYAAERGYSPCGDALELYHVDVHDTRFVEEYLTEVQLPLSQNVE